jgi:hypothetical protein
MAQRQISYQEVADLCRVSIHTVRAWMKPPSSKGSTQMPDMAVDLLCLKLRAAPPRWQGIGGR